MTSFRPYLLAACCAAALGAAPLTGADSFTANLATVNPGQTLELTYQADAPLSTDVYLAAQYNGALLFVDEQGGIVAYQPGTATPPRLRSPGAGSHKLFSFAMPEGFYTSLTFYQVAGKPGSDLLGTGNYDSATLRTVSVSFAAKTAGASGGGNGRALYAENCTSCHGPNPGENIANIQSGGDAQKTITAIKKDSGGMKYLSFLTSDEISAIAKWIANPI
ncbi:MAG: c-type cytochrome [Sulfuricella sp.]|nr:c-type cytochrome [Sulfuricella sp.]